MSKKKIIIASVLIGLIHGGVLWLSIKLDIHINIGGGRYSNIWDSIPFVPIIILASYFISKPKKLLKVLQNLILVSIIEFLILNLTLIIIFLALP